MRRNNENIKELGQTTIKILYPRNGNFLIKFSN